MSENMMYVFRRHHSYHAKTALGRTLVTGGEIFAILFFVIGSLNKNQNQSRYRFFCFIGGIAFAVMIIGMIYDIIAGF